MSINTNIWELLILHQKKNVKPSPFHDVIETENNFSLLKRKSFNDSQGSEVFDDTLFD